MTSRKKEEQYVGSATNGVYCGEHTSCAKDTCSRHTEAGIQRLAHRGWDLILASFERYQFEQWSCGVFQSLSPLLCEILNVPHLLGPG